MYRTSNQAYGSRAPTVHEMPVRRKPRKVRRWGISRRRLRLRISQKSNTSGGGGAERPAVPTARRGRAYLNFFWDGAG